MHKSSLSNHVTVAALGFVSIPLVTFLGALLYCVYVWAPAMRVDPNYEAGEDGIAMGAFLGTMAVGLYGVIAGLLWPIAVGVFFVLRSWLERRRLTSRCS